MSRNHQKNSRILAISLTNRGFGFAVMEPPETLVDWGVKTVRGDKNAQCVEKIEDMLNDYAPGLVVLEDASAKGSRRSTRIRILCAEIVAAASLRKVGVSLLSREHVRRVFFGDYKGTKDALAGILAKRFPEEIENRLPPKRRPWMSEDYRMAIFDAVALGLGLGAIHDQQDRRHGMPHLRT
ncbi:MAG: hypothetical protein AB1705_25045 [Verrucomicrobiota bacterium]